MAIRSKLIEASVDVPSVIELTGKKATLEIPVRLELANTSEHDYVLHGPAGDDQSFWHVLDEDHREVTREAVPQAKRPRVACDLQICSLTIAAGHKDQETTTLRLDASKLEEGKTYTVRAEHWGQVGEATFVVFRGGTGPAAPPPVAEDAEAPPPRATRGARKAPAARKPAPKKGGKRRR